MKVTTKRNEYSIYFTYFPETPNTIICKIEVKTDNSFKLKGVGSFTGVLRRDIRRKKAFANAVRAIKSKKERKTLWKNFFKEYEYGYNLK